MSGRELPDGRYGSSRRRRGAGPALLVVALVVAVAVAVVGYRNLAGSPIRTELLGYTLLDGSSVQVRFGVARDDPSRPAVCIVRARSLDGDETGRREVYVPPAGGRIELTAVVRTSRPPVAGDVFGCALDIPPYLEPAGAPAVGTRSGR